MLQHLACLSSKVTKKEIHLQSDSIFVTILELWSKTYLNLSFLYNDKLYRSLKDRAVSITIAMAILKKHANLTSFYSYFIIFIIKLLFFITLLSNFICFYYYCSESYEKIIKGVFHE